MKAMTQQVYGGPEAISMQDVDQPVPGDRKVLVRVRAAALNLGDVFFMRGEPYLLRAAAGLRRPRFPVRGMDFAGRVEAVGKDVTQVHVGDDVFGYAMGACAEW